MFLNARIRQYYAAFSCTMSTMMAASSFAWFTPILNELLSDHSPVPMTVDQSSWMIALVEIGEFVGPIPAGILINRWGRKNVLLTTFPMIAATWIIILLNTRSVVAIYVVRLIQGFAMGVVFIAGPVYLAEISEPKIRGRLCGMFYIMWMLGLLWDYCTGPFLSYDMYAYVTSSHCLIFVASYILLPETPYYLIMKNREEDARKSLMYFRNGNIDEELKSIKQSLSEEQEESSWYDLFKTAEDRKVLLVVTCCCFVKHMSGVSTLTEYLNSIVDYTGGHDKINSNYITIIITLIALVAALVSSSVVDWLGRRPLIFMSTIGAVLINATAGTYYLLVDLKVRDILDYSWIAYTCLASYFIVSNVGIAPLTQTLQAECFSSKNRGKAGTFIVCVSTVLIFLCLKQFQPFINWFGISLDFFSFAIYSLIGSIGIFAFMKETAGKSLGEIQEQKRTKK